jgi:hypothetical protein
MHQEATKEPNNMHYSGLTPAQEIANLDFAKRPDWIDLLCRHAIFSFYCMVWVQQDLIIVHGMKRKFPSLLTCLFGLLLMLLVTGCPLYLDYPAAPENACNFDGTLLGKWKTEMEDVPVRAIAVSRGGSTGYNVRVEEHGSSYSEDTYDYQCFSTEVNGKNVVWCQPQGTDTKGYYYYVFELGKKKSLKLWEISDKDIDKATITSMEDAAAMLEERLKTDAFLLQPIVFKRD